MPSILKQYECKHHPAKAILNKEFGIKISTIANYVGCSYSHINSILNGVYKTPEKHDKKLWELVDLVRKERGYECKPDKGGCLTSC